MDQTELDSLQALADTTDAANGAPQVDQTTGDLLPPPPPPIDYMGEAGAAVDVFAALAVGYAPAAGRLWDDAAKQRIKAALAPVMQKYNFSIGAMPPEITLLIVAGPVLYQTSKIMAAQMAEQKAKPAPIEQQQKDPHAGQLDPRRPNESPEILRSPQTALYPG